MRTLLLAMAIVALTLCALAAQRRPTHPAESVSPDCLLSDAISRNDLPALAGALASGAPPNGSPHTFPLFEACHAGRSKAAAILLQNNADPNFHWPGGYTPLMIAAAHDRLDLVELLLHYGANPNQLTDSQHDSALHQCARSPRGSAEVTALLIRAGADPNALNTHRLSPLLEAVQADNPAIVQTLLAAGASPSHAAPCPFVAFSRSTRTAWCLYHARVLP